MKFPVPVFALFSPTNLKIVLMFYIQGIFTFAATHTDGFFMTYIIVKYGNLHEF